MKFRNIVLFAFLATAVVGCGRDTVDGNWSYGKERIEVEKKTFYYANAVSSRGRAMFFCQDFDNNDNQFDSIRMEFYSHDQKFTDEQFRRSNRTIRTKIRAGDMTDYVEMSTTSSGNAIIVKNPRYVENVLLASMSRSNTFYLKPETFQQAIKIDVSGGGEVFDRVMDQCDNRLVLY